MQVVCCGLACIDIVNTLPRYPKEDEELRISESHKTRGGNATNTLVVLGQLGARGTWAGTTTDPAADADSVFVTQDLAKYNVDGSRAVFIPGSKGLPTSYIILSQESGSRTIAHYRGTLPELSSAQFMDSMFGPFGGLSPASLARWQWYHFEGRNCEETAVTLRCLRDCRGSSDDAATRPWRDYIGPSARGPCISVEIEKVHAASEALFPLGDVIFLSKEFAGKKGFTRPQDFLAHVSPAAAPGALLVCPWGSAGAWALDLAAPEGSQLSFSAAFPPEGGVVDSIGAGDTFLAAMVFALGKGAAVQAGLTFACQVAGMKCGLPGFHFPTIPALPV